MREFVDRRVVLLASEEEVSNGLRQLESLLSAKPDITCFILGSGFRRASTYREIAHSFEADILLDSGGSLAASLARTIFGTRAVMQPKSMRCIVELIEAVGQQSMATVFVLKRSVAAALMSGTRVCFAEVRSALESGGAFAAVSIDEDAAGTRDRVAAVIEVWPDCPSDLSAGLDAIWQTDIADNAKAT